MAYFYILKERIFKKYMMDGSTVETNKKFTCKKSVFILALLFSVLPMLYLWEHGNAVNWWDAAAILLIILVCINSSCNNYKLLFTAEEVILERLIGRTLDMKLRSIYQIEMREVKKDTKLLMYTKQGDYQFSIRCLDEEKIHNYLLQRVPEWGITYKKRSETDR